MTETKPEAHIATLRKTSASGIAEAGSWSKLLAGKGPYSPDKKSSPKRP